MVLAFDRFFTSVQLMNSLQYPSVGTAILKKKIPEKRKSNKGECEFLTHQLSLFVTKCKDTKQVIQFSNCHDPIRKGKTCHKVDVPCSGAIAFYYKIMDGMDVVNQLTRSDILGLNVRLFDQYMF